MHHVAIMKKSWELIPKIISGEKTIESRWYQTRRTPWNKINPGDTVFFKNSGERVTAQATVSRVKQFELNTLDDARRIVRKFGKQICIINADPARWGRLPRYCILIFLSAPTALKEPFDISKKGFGSAAAWLTMPKVQKLP
jgi:ASC-1-like (ASCH) protein